MSPVSDGVIAPDPFSAKEGPSRMAARADGMAVSEVAAVSSRRRRRRAAAPRPAYITSGFPGSSSRRTRIAMTVTMSASTVAPAPIVSAVVTPLDSA